MYTLNEIRRLGSVIKNETKRFFNTGARIDDGYVYANDLTSGQTQEFKIFTYVSSDKVEEMKNATFKVVEVSMY